MSEESVPSSNGANGNGRTHDGKFAPGWKGGPGNPFGKQAAEFRSLLMTTVTHEDFVGIIRKLVEKALKGDNFAAAQVLDRLIGKPAQTHMISADPSSEDVASELRAVVEGMDFRSRRAPM